MAEDETARGEPTHRRWAHFRFSVIGSLLAAPPERGELAAALTDLAARDYTHPITREPFRLGVSTIERWYYQARNEPVDPVGALRKKVRKDSGRQRTIGPALRAAIQSQYRRHPRWSYKLHFDNILAQTKKEPALGELPCYATVRRYMKANGLFRSRRRRVDTEAGRRAEQRLIERETRSFEASHVGSLWHFDFHSCSRKVLTRSGELVTPKLFASMDDHSRLGCHLQWYLDETAETLAHGLAQAIMKRGLPREAMSDNGSAMVAGEIRQGLVRLGIKHCRTLEHSPHQNGKQENFFSQVEGRLMPMLEGKRELTLSLLNEATLAWLEREYNRSIHSETGQTPIERFTKGSSLMRPAPASEVIRDAFRQEVTRTQRRGDGTISLESRRYEVPARYRHMTRVTVRYARWDMSWVHLVDPRTDATLCRLFPLDKAANADGRRRRMSAPAVEPVASDQVADEMAPLLEQLMREQAATGLPPAYIPKDDKVTYEQEEEDGR